MRDRGWRESAGSLSGSGHADELQFSFQRFAVERLHHIFVGAGFDRSADMVDAVLRGAEEDQRPLLDPEVSVIEGPQKFTARSEGRLVGQKWLRTVSDRWATYH